MSCVKWKVVVPETSVTGSSTVTLAVFQAPTNQRVKISLASASFKGTSNTAAPVLVEIYQITSGGSLGTGTSATFIKDPIDLPETVQTTGKVALTVEPTGTAKVSFSEEVHPQQGYTEARRFSDDFTIPGGTWWGLRVTPPATVTVTARIEGEE